MHTRLGPLRSPCVVSLSCVVLYSLLVASFCYIPSLPRLPTLLQSPISSYFAGCPDTAAIICAFLGEWW